MLQCSSASPFRSFTVQLRRLPPWPVASARRPKPPPVAAVAVRLCSTPKTLVPIFPQVTSRSLFLRSTQFVHGFFSEHEAYGSAKPLPPDAFPAGRV
uniref:Uncharacterized protein n=1 Tax=Oryza brachyantha TaxID=4533 RepID=J3M1Z0_ORYBR